jgi:predicted F0F1-ATPase subunit
MQRRVFWGAVASLTSLGWVMALPIALGVIVGGYLDHRLGTGGGWSLALLGVGIGIAALEAYLALRRALRSKNHG